MLNFKMRKKAYIRTFGCQMNVHDSEKMAGILLRENYILTGTPKDADLIIFNTCSIRQKAEQKFKSELGKAKLLKRKKTDLKIAVAGCIAQQRGGEISGKNSNVDYVLGPQNISRLGKIICGNDCAVAVEENPDIEYTNFPAKRGDNIKAWVSIMYGCNNFCSYCIVPYTRGRERSRPSEDIYTEISDLALRGFREVTLLGQNVNSYRSDVDFAGLLSKINMIEGIERIRFVTSHPRDLSGHLIASLGELEKVCEHIHLPVQSGSDRILSLMNRGYARDNYLQKIENLRRQVPEIAITTDIISGFPTETDDDHRATLEALNAVEYDGIFAFRFSPRPGTKAARMADDVPDDIKAGRLREILELQDKITLQRNRALEGTIQEVLVEGPCKTGKEKMTGRTRTNKIVNFTAAGTIPGSLVRVRIVKAMRHSLDGEPVE